MCQATHLYFGEHSVKFWLFIDPAWPSPHQPFRKSWLQNHHCWLYELYPTLHFQLWCRHYIPILLILPVRLVYACPAKSTCPTFNQEIAGASRGSCYCSFCGFHTRILGRFHWFKRFRGFWDLKIFSGYGDGSKPIITMTAGITIQLDLGYHPGTRLLTHRHILKICSRYCDLIYQLYPMISPYSWWLNHDKPW